MRGAQLLLLALILLSAHLLFARDAHSSQVITPGFSDADRIELERLRTVAKKAPANEREPCWFEVARFALRHSQVAAGASVADPKPITEALDEATSRLGPSSLAALGPVGRHPRVSEAYVRALAAGSPADQAEAIAEARAALEWYGPKDARAVLDPVKGLDVPAAEAGGVQRSVYLVLVTGTFADSADADFLVLRGVKAGLAQSAGAWADRFGVYEQPLWDEAQQTGAAVTVGPGGYAGVFVHAGDAVGWAGTSAAARAVGAVVLDARPAETPGPRSFVESEARNPDLESRLRRSHILRHFGPGLGYVRIAAIPGTSDAPGGVVPANLAFVLRPTAVERARRLAEALLARPTVPGLAIAIPTSGGDFAFASAFLEALRASGKDARILPYEPGRRAYTAEADSFIGSGARAIVFAGPGEESGEWLTALAKKGVRPLVLGSIELDPAGFHPPTRGLLEGAILVGEDWVDRNPALVERMKREGEVADDPSFRRGYRAGWAIGRSVVEGAFSPTRLRAELVERSSGRWHGEGAYLLTAIEKGAAGLKPEEVVVPVFTVKGGVAEPVPGF